MLLSYADSRLSNHASLPCYRGSLYLIFILLLLKFLLYDTALVLLTFDQSNFFSFGHFQEFKKCILAG